MDGLVSEREIKNVLKGVSYVPSRLTTAGGTLHATRGFVVFTLDDSRLAVRYEGAGVSYDNNPQKTAHMMVNRMDNVLSIAGYTTIVKDVDGDPRVVIARKRADDSDN